MVKMAIRTLCAVSAYIILWGLGNVVFLRGTPIGDVRPEQQVHLAIVLAISVGVVLRAATVRGSVEDRLKQSIISITVLFGSYALLILIGRQFFSRSILATVVPATFVVSLVVIWLRNRHDGVRAAVIAPLVQSIPEGLGKTNILSDPAADFRPYDLLLVDLRAPVSADWASALSRAMLCGCRIRHIEDHVEELSGAVSIPHFELEHLPSTNQDSYIAIKRLMDVVGVLLLAPLAIPIIMISAAGVVLTSGWPAMFIRSRVGLGGAHFRMWKLRTMRPTSPNEADQAAVLGDSRVTGIGRLLRRTRIDELPQLWNVLKGDMSLIGPRPETVAFHNSYVAVEPKFAYRCLVRPGITGWAQVNAPPSENADQAIFKARYDLYYIKKQSLALDLYIGIRTLWTVVHGGGAR
jgi:lipopolysaccharide/colanic/teichoic acid biosynthesis glycosyltransferase